MATATRRKTITVGLPAGASDRERRFPLTPEAAAMLVERGYRVKMETGAAEVIHYTDTSYTHSGVDVTDRTSTLGCDIVIHLAPLPECDIMKMRKGAMLLSLACTPQRTAGEIRTLLKRSITTIALDLIEDAGGHTPFADILAEVEGRGAITLAASRLADPEADKGILLGGIAGVVPCEVTVIGSGIAARAAARAAMGAGASVRMFDNDIYSLRCALHDLDGRAVGSALHPKVVANALRSADIVVVTRMAREFDIDDEMRSIMKRRVIVMDIAGSGSSSSLAGIMVPRTASMALSNTLLTLFGEIASLPGATPAAALKILPGLRKGACTFMGKVVNPGFAEAAGLRNGDINIYLTLS